ncbi:kynurenine formamidase [Christiangramia gaetbulicola]|uniref:Kynurenine formamidase n=1 Tax=Christiangramia gaetbulicola TaxID=703340 RepID=A0A2T6AIQ6_9FLAO|nr:cyclase family protein [Christiangramia gaetbulicola]PTX43693.1 kynurenine formamidase [Christiangramia gaetbulicola]
MKNFKIFFFLLITSLTFGQDIEGEIIDLTHTFSEESVYWVTAKEFQLEEVAKGNTGNGYYYSANNFSTAEHGGTHIDAPIHFAENKQTVDQIPLENLIGTGVKIDVSAKALKNPDYLISIEDLKNWESEHSEIPQQSIILLYTGYGKYYPDAKKYLGTDERGPDAVKKLHFPGLSPEAANWLIKNRNIKAVGLDTASIDYGQSTNFATHVALMTQNVPAFENVANLEKLPATGFQVIALPMKIKGGSGGPLRIIAIR